MRLSIRQRSPLTFVLIATSSTLFAASCLDLQVTSETAGAGGAGSSSSGEPTSSSGEVSSSSASSASSSSSGSASSSSSASSASSSSGMVAVCGNGIIEGAEKCDDGNTSAGDGCGPACELESAANCPAEIVNLGKGQKITITDSTANATDTFKGTVGGTPGNCLNGSWMGPDAIYLIAPKANGNLSVTADVGYANALLHARSQCPGMSSDQLICEYRTNAGILSWTLPVSQNTLYYVAVDAFTSSGGPFQVTFELQ